MSDLLVKSVLTAGAFTAGALTIFACEYPRAYFKFYCILIWVLAEISITLSTCDGNIEHAYQVHIPQQGFSEPEIRTINDYAYSSNLLPCVYMFLKILSMYVTLLITVPLWMLGLDKRQH